MIQLIHDLYLELESLSTGCLAFLLLLLIGLMTFYSVKSSQNDPPGPKGFPFLGVLPLLTDRPDKQVLKWAQKYGDVMSLPFINNKIIVISSFDALKEGPIHQGEDYGDRPNCFFHDEILKKNGISSTSVSRNWKEQRQFTLKSLRKFGFGRPVIISKIIEETDHFCDVMIKSKGDFSVGRTYLNELSANIIFQLCMNRRFSFEERQDFLQFFHKLSKKFNEASFALQATIFVPWLSCFPPFRSTLKDLKEFVDKFEKNIEKELKVHFESFEESLIRDFTDDYVNEMKSRDLENEGLFNKTTLMYILRDLFVAGTETTASTITWALLILCNRKKTVLKKIHEEIEKVIGPINKPTSEDRLKMPYMMAFLQELVRFRTIAPFSLPRMTTRETKLGKYTIPAGVTVIENLYAVHNDPKNWKNPEEFIVERHLDKNSEFIKSPKVIPFGVGVRYCIGKQLAELQLFIVLVRILQRFDITSGSEEFQDEEPANGGFVTMASFDTKIMFVPK